MRCLFSSDGRHMATVSIKLVRGANDFTTSIPVKDVQYARVDLISDGTYVASPDLVTSNEDGIVMIPGEPPHWYSLRDHTKRSLRFIIGRKEASHDLQTKIKISYH